MWHRRLSVSVSYVSIRRCHRALSSPRTRGMRWTLSRTSISALPRARQAVDTGVQASYCCPAAHKRKHSRGQSLTFTRASQLRPKRAHSGHPARGACKCADFLPGSKGGSRRHPDGG